MNSITITGSTGSLDTRSNDFDTQEEAEAFEALFPKSYKFRASRHTTSREIPGTDRNEWYDVYVVRSNAYLSADDVNGGKNETGIARISKIVRKAEKLGIDVRFEQARYTNALTVEQMKEMI